MTYREQAAWLRDIRSRISDIYRVETFLIEAIGTVIEDLEDAEG